MIISMNLHQQQESKGFRTHQSMPNLSVWNGVGSPPVGRNPFLPSSTQQLHPQPASHKRSRDPSAAAAAAAAAAASLQTIAAEQENHQSREHQQRRRHQRQEQHQQQQICSNVMMSQPLDQTSSIQWVPMTSLEEEESRDSGGRGKKCRSNQYRAPTQVQTTVTSAMGTLVGGSMQQTPTSVQMRRQLSGGHLDQFLTGDQMEDEYIDSPESRPRSMSF